MGLDALELFRTGAPPIVLVDLPHAIIDAAKPSGGSALMPARRQTPIIAITAALLKRNRRE